MAKKLISIREIVEPIIGGFWGQTVEQPGTGNARVVRNGDILESGYISKKVPERILTQKEIQKSKLRKGDILITMSGNVGRVARVVEEVDSNGLPLVASNFVKILRPKKGINADYLYFYLKSKDFQSEIKKYTRGVAIQNLSTKVFDQQLVPELSLAQQEDIATKLLNIESLKRKRVEADQKTENLFNFMFNDAFGNLNTTDLPKRPLKEVTVFVTDGTHLPPPFTTEGIPFLFVKNITKGFIDFNTEKYVSEESYIKLTKKYRPQKYDILYSTVGSYGVAVMVGTDNKFTFQRHIGHIRPDTKIILPEFLNAQLNTAFVKKQADLKVRGVAQKTLNLDELRKIVIVVPPMERQRSFVEKLKKLQDIQIKQKESGIKIDNLFTSLLAKHTNN